MRCRTQRRPRCSRTKAALLCARIFLKNPAAAIFLAKNHLGMSDNPQPVDTGEKRREFESAIKIGAKALAGMDLSGVMDVPPRKHITQEAEDDGDD